MRFGLDVPVNGAYADPRLLGRLAAEAERAGWDGFFVQDIFSSVDPVADPWIALTAAALATERVAIGSLLTPLPRRRPWEVARQAATLDQFSGGRLIFAAGLGNAEQDFTPFGDPWDPLVRAELLDEGLDIIRGMWTGEPFSYSGNHFELNEALLRPSPVQAPRIPVWLATGWPRRRPLRRAARWEGVYLMTERQDTGQLLSPEDITQIANFLREHRGDGTTGDIAFNPEQTADAARTRDQVQAFSEAGATWWIDMGPDSGPNAYLTHIRNGPPQP